MDTSTHPNQGVEQAPQTPEDRISAILSRGEATEPEEVEAQGEQPAPQAEEEAEASEGIAEETEVEAPPPVEDVFEIVHNGTQVKLTREDAIKYARQGFDYTEKTQQLAEERRAVQHRVQALSEVEQVAPFLQQERAQLAALEGQLSQYQNVDWVKLATEDPLEYPKHRAQYDVLVNAYQQGRASLDYKQNQVNERLAYVKAQMLQEEFNKLPQLIPAWRDQESMAKGREELTNWLISNGVPPERIGPATQDAFTVATIWKAAQYDKLMSAKKEKVGLVKKLPPVPVPGASKPDAAKADRDKDLRTKLRKSGNMDDAVSLLLNRL